MHLTPGPWRLFVVAMVSYCSWVVALGGTADGFLDPATSYVSELSAEGQPLRVLFRSADALAGGLVVAAAVLQAKGTTANDAPPSPRGRPLHRAAVAGMALFGGATVFDALWTFACARTQDERCLAAESTGALPWHHQAHEVTSTLVGVGLTLLLALPLVSAPLGLMTVSRRRLAIMVAGTIVSIVTLVVSIMLGPPLTPRYADAPLPLGTVQRLSLAATVITLLVAYAPTPRKSPRHDHR